MAPVGAYGNFTPSGIQQPAPELIRHSRPHGHPNVAAHQLGAESGLITFRGNLAFAADLQQRANLIADVGDEIELQSATSSYEAEFNGAGYAPYPPNLLDETLLFLRNRCALSRLGRGPARDLADRIHQDTLALCGLRVEQPSHERCGQRLELQAIGARCQFAPTQANQPMP